MAEGNYLTWNMTNWITVVLMVAIGLTITAAVASFIRQGLPSSES